MCSHSKNDKERQPTVSEAKTNKNPTVYTYLIDMKIQAGSAWFSFRNGDQGIASTILVKTKRTAF